MTLTQITEKGIKDGEIINADINPSAAIAGTKINPVFTSDISITNAIPRISLYDSGENPDWEIGNINGAFRFRDLTNATTWMQINTDGHTDINGGLDVTGAITGSGDLTIDGDTLYVDSTNNRVGIETSSPNNTLDVHGVIVCSPNTDGKDTFELSTHAWDEGRLKIKNVDTTTVQIRAGGDSYFNGGNVGIGTSNPSGALHIEAGGNNLQLSRSSFDTFQFGIGTGSGINGLFIVNTTDNFSAVTISEGCGANALVLASGGNCGLGTSSPGRQLEVNSNTSNTFIRIKSSDTGNAGLEFGDQSDTVQGAIYQDSSDNSLKINGYNNATRILIDSTGNVGIGTTSPSEQLHVIGGNIKTDATSRQIGYWETDGVHDGYLIPYNSSGKVELVSSYTTGGILFKTGTSKNTSMVINSSGNVGIGEASPSHKLHISAAENSTIAYFDTALGGRGLKINTFVSGNAASAGVEFEAPAGAAKSAFAFKGASQFMRIDSDGLKFNADTAEVNALDDYEEGTWTPTFPNNGTGNQALGTYLAEYVKIGRFVYAYIYANISGAPQSNSSLWVIGGLPFNANVSTLVHHGTGNVTYVGGNSYSQWRPLITNYGQIYFHRTDGSTNVLKNSDVANEGMTHWIMGLNYMTST